MTSLLRVMAAFGSEVASEGWLVMGRPVEFVETFSEVDEGRVVEGIVYRLDGVTKWIDFQSPLLSRASAAS